jgi:hypothetical protein
LAHREIAWDGEAISRDAHAHGEAELESGGLANVPIIRLKPQKIRIGDRRQMAVLHELDRTVPIALDEDESVERVNDEGLLRREHLYAARLELSYHLLNAIQVAREAARNGDS